MQKCVKKLHFYKIIFAYDGSRFAGSAKQPGGQTVQDALDAALRRLGAVSLAGAGDFGLRRTSFEGVSEISRSMNSHGLSSGDFCSQPSNSPRASCAKLAADSVREQKSSRNNAAKLADKSAEAGDLVNSADALSLSGRIGFSGASGGVSDGGEAAEKPGAITQLASRTDRGVHALTNVAKAAFAYRPDARYLAAKITRECPGLAVRAACEVGADFQPRFAVRGRSYRYVFALDFARAREFSALPQRVNLCDLSAQNFGKSGDLAKLAAFGDAAPGGGMALRGKISSNDGAEKSASASTDSAEKSASADEKSDGDASSSRAINHFSAAAAFSAHYAAALPQEFCLAAFVAGARELLGEHDFALLCLSAEQPRRLAATADATDATDGAAHPATATAQTRSTRRRIHRVRVYLHDGKLVFNIFSTGFLRGQIRLIIGALLAVAAGKITHEQWREQLAAKRAHWRISAPAGGLYLKSIYY